MDTVPARPHLRTGLSVTALALVLSACAPGGSTEVAAPTTAATATASDAPHEPTAEPTDADPTADEATREGGGATHTDQASTSPTTAVPTPTASPTPEYTPQIVCPHVIALEPTFAVEGLGVDATTGTERVRVTMTYTNPVAHPLYLTGSLGYVDSAGYEADLYSTDPGELTFDDEPLAPGAGTLTRELEDVWAESTGSQIHFTFWLMTGVALDSGDQPPCEENRGYSNH